MSTFRERFQKIVSKLSDKDYRNAYVEGHIDTGLAFQIRDMRKDRGWTQKQFAEKINTKQTSISRFEDPNYGKHSLETLKRMASLFDVALMVKFVPYSELARKTCNMTASDLVVPSFHNDPALHLETTDTVTSISQYSSTPSPKLQPVKISRLSTRSTASGVANGSR